MSDQELRRFIEEIKILLLEVLQERYPSVECKVWRFPTDAEIEVY